MDAKTSVRIRLIGGILAFLAVTFGVLLNSENAQATSTQIMAAVATQASTTLDTVFASNTTSYSYASGQQVTLSTCPDAACTVAADDDIKITFTRPDASVVALDILSRTQDVPALNVTSYLQVGSNTVKVELIDRFAPQRGLPRPLYLVTSTSPLPGGLTVVVLPTGLPFSNNPNVRSSIDPVNTLTGSFTLERTDVAITGRGPSPTFTRFYDSSNTLNGPLGPGWVHNYSTRLVRPDASTQDIVLITPEGRGDRFTHSGGNYTAPSGVSSTLVKNMDGTYRVTAKSQSYMLFDEQGKLTKLGDRYGNESVLSHDGSLEANIFYTFKFINFLRLNNSNTFGSEGDIIT